MGLSKRQKVYREYLKGDHWKALRAACFARDGWVCVICGTSEGLQAHHEVYRGRYEDTLLEDLTTLCRKDHRLAHGIGPTEFDSKAREIDQTMLLQKRPTVQQWRELKSLARDDYDTAEFGSLMFKYILHVWADERERHVYSWWMNKKVANFWFERAYAVKQSIWKRMKVNVRETF